MMKMFHNFLYNCPSRLKDYYYNDLHQGNKSFYEEINQLKFNLDQDKLTSYRS